MFRLVAAVEGQEMRRRAGGGGRGDRVSLQSLHSTVLPVVQLSSLRLHCYVPLASDATRADVNASRDRTGRQIRDAKREKNG